MIVTFIGHAKIHYNSKVEEKIIEALENYVDGRDVTFYMGLDGRFDWLAKKCCLKYKEKYGNARIVFVTPYVDEIYLKNLRFAIEGFDEVLYPDLEKVPSRSKRKLNPPQRRSFYSFPQQLRCSTSSTTAVALAKNN